MHLTVPAVLVVSGLLVGTAWAQSSSSGGGGTGSSSGSSGSSTGSVPSPGNPSALPRSGQGARTPDDPAPNADRRVVPQNRANTPPIPLPGSEGSTGGTAARRTDGTTTGGISGTNRRPGEPSAIGPSSREEELLKEGEQLEQKAKEGVCQGC